VLGRAVPGRSRMRSARVDDVTPILPPQTRDPMSAGPMTRYWCVLEAPVVDTLTPQLEALPTMHEAAGEEQEGVETGAGDAVVSVAPRQSTGAEAMAFASGGAWLCAGMVCAFACDAVFCGLSLPPPFPAPASDTLVTKASCPSPIPHVPRPILPFFSCLCVG
jgi:hypothetical protein